MRYLIVGALLTGTGIAGNGTYQKDSPHISEMYRAVLCLH